MGAEVGEARPTDEASASFWLDSTAAAVWAGTIRVAAGCVVDCARQSEGRALARRSAWSGGQPRKSSPSRVTVPPENVAPLKLTVPGEAFGGGGGTELGGGGGEPFVEPGQLVEVPLPAVGDDQGDRGAQAGDHGQDDLRGVLAGGALVHRTELPRPVPAQ